MVALPMDDSGMDAPPMADKEEADAPPPMEDIDAALPPMPDKAAMDTP
jgi:hypothetical protein